MSFAEPTVGMGELSQGKCYFKCEVCPQVFQGLNSRFFNGTQSSQANPKSVWDFGSSDELLESYFNPHPPSPLNGSGIRSSGHKSPEIGAENPKIRKCLGPRKKPPKKDVSKKESHIWSERERRKEMNQLFSALKDVLPEPVEKADKFTLLSEGVKYIQALQQHLKELSQRRKTALESRPKLYRRESNRLASSSPGGASNASDNSNMSSCSSMECLRPPVSSNVVLMMCESNAFLFMTCKKQKSLLSRIIALMNKHDVEIVNANISTTNAAVFHHMHIKVNGMDFSRKALEAGLQEIADNCS